jgi:NitT/TauT family transport system substrate-binding protein
LENFRAGRRLLELREISDFAISYFFVFMRKVCVRRKLLSGVRQSQINHGALVSAGREVKNSRRLFALLALIALLPLLVSSSCKGPATKTYRIGLGPWVGFGPLYLAQEKGFFRDAGVTVDLSVLTGLSERNSALKSGQVDALAAPVDYFVLSAGNHLETTIVMEIDESVGGDGIIANSSIQKFEDLKARRVAFQRGLPSEFFLRALLQQHGMRLEDLKAIDMETAQAGAAFIAKQLDAAGLWEPWLTKAKEQGGGHILASTKDYPNLIVDCVAFNRDVVSQHADDVQKIVNAIFRAIDYWKDHPQEANAIMAPHFQVDAAKYAVILSGARFADLARNQQYFGTANTPGPVFDVAKRASALWLDAKVIQTPVKPETIISTNFVQGGK